MINFTSIQNKGFQPNLDFKIIYYFIYCENYEINNSLAISIDGLVF